MGFQSYVRDFYKSGFGSPKTEKCHGYMIEFGMRKYKEISPVAQRFFGFSYRIKEVDFPKANLDESNTFYDVYQKVDEMSHVFFETWGIKKSYHTFIWEYYFGAGLLVQPNTATTITGQGGMDHVLMKNMSTDYYPFVTFGLNIGLSI